MHFFGPLWFILRKGVCALHGQQRLTTLMLLIKALHLKQEQYMPLRNALKSKTL